MTLRHCDNITMTADFDPLELFSSLQAIVFDEMMPLINSRNEAEVVISVALCVKQLSSFVRALICTVEHRTFLHALAKTSADSDNQIQFLLLSQALQKSALSCDRLEEDVHCSLQQLSYLQQRLYHYAEHNDSIAMELEKSNNCQEIALQKQMLSEKEFEMFRMIGRLLSMSIKKLPTPTICHKDEHLTNENGDSRIRDESDNLHDSIGTDNPNIEPASKRLKTRDTSSSTSAKHLIAVEALATKSGDGDHVKTPTSSEYSSEEIVMNAL